jgi:hypothetical protein
VPCLLADPGTAVGRAVGSKKGEALLCLVYAGFFGDIRQPKDQSVFNVLESRQLSISSVSEQCLPREMLIK